MTGHAFFRNMRSWRVVFVLLLLGLFGSCMPLATPDHGDTHEEEEEPEETVARERSWLIIVYGLVDSTLETSFDRAVGTVSAEPDPSYSLHRVVYRENSTGVEAWSVPSGRLADESWDRRAIDTSIVGSTLGTSEALATVVAAAADAFPATRLMLILWGMGHGRFGVGGTNGDATPAFRGHELSAGFADRPPADVLVVDAAWSNHLEFLADLSTVAHSIITPDGYLPVSGFDYTRLVSALAGADPREPPDAPAMADLLTVDMTQVGATVVTGAMLPGLIDSCSVYFAAAEAAIVSVDVQGAIRDHLVRRSERIGTSADCVVSFVEVVESISDVLPTAVDPTPLIDAHASAVTAGADVVFLMKADSNGLPLPFDDYCSSDGVASQSVFCRRAGWAPDLVSGTGLLYRLFYTQF